MDSKAIKTTNNQQNLFAHHQQVPSQFTKRQTHDMTMLNPNRKGDNNNITKFMNLFIYIICITSLGASLYSNYRQSYNEDERLRQIIHLDNRITALEAVIGGLQLERNNQQHQYPHDNKNKNINNNPLDIVNKKHLITSSLSSAVSMPISSAYFFPSAAKVSPSAGANRDDIVTEINNKVSHQLASIQRLKRDVQSNLQMSRKVMRQASIQQSPNECLCPPGECIIYL